MQNSVTLGNLSLSPWWFFLAKRYLKKSEKCVSYDTGIYNIKTDFVSIQFEEEISTMSSITCTLFCTINSFIRTRVLLRLEWEVKYKVFQLNSDLNIHYDKKKCKNFSKILPFLMKNKTVYKQYSILATE